MFAEERMKAMAERTIRKALIETVTRSGKRQLPEDDSYELAMAEAATDPYIAANRQRFFLQGDARIVPHPRKVLSSMRAAYQHILAAERLGVATVGEELIEESVITLEWISADLASKLVDYLSLILQRGNEHISIFREVKYSELVETAMLASRIYYVSLSFPKTLRDTSFSWVPTIRDDKYATEWLLNVALAMDKSFRDDAESLAARKDFRYAVYELHQDLARLQQRALTAGEP
jgi:hypothetical protein